MMVHTLSRIPAMNSQAKSKNHCITVLLQWNIKSTAKRRENIPFLSKCSRPFPYCSLHESNRISGTVGLHTSSSWWSLKHASDSVASLPSSELNQSFTRPSLSATRKVRTNSSVPCGNGNWSLTNLTVGLGVLNREGARDIMLPSHQSLRLHLSIKLWTSSYFERIAVNDFTLRESLRLISANTIKKSQIDIHHKAIMYRHISIH